MKKAEVTTKVSVATKASKGGRNQLTTISTQCRITVHSCSEKLSLKTVQHISSGYCPMLFGG